MYRCCAEIELQGAEPDIQNRIAGRLAFPEETTNWRAQAVDLFDQTERSKHRNSGLLQHVAGAYELRFFKLMIENDVMAIARQKNGGCKPAYPCAAATSSAAL